MYSPTIKTFQNNFVFVHLHLQNHYLSYATQVNLLPHSLFYLYSPTIKIFQNNFVFIHLDLQNHYLSYATQVNLCEYKARKDC